MGERAEVGEGTIGAIGSIEPTIADGLEQPTLMVPTGYDGELIGVGNVVFDDPFSSFSRRIKEYGESLTSFDDQDNYFVHFFTSSLNPWMLTRPM